MTPIECLHYTLSLPTSVVIAGLDSMEILDQAFAAVESFHPLTKDEVDALLAKTRHARRPPTFPGSQVLAQPRFWKAVRSDDLLDLEVNRIELRLSRFPFLKSKAPRVIKYGASRP